MPRANNIGDMFTQKENDEQVLYRRRMLPVIQQEFWEIEFEGIDYAKEHFSHFTPEQLDNAIKGHFHYRMPMLADRAVVLFGKFITLALKGTHGLMIIEEVMTDLRSDYWLNEDTANSMRSIFKMLRNYER